MGSFTKNNTDIDIDRPYTFIRPVKYVIENMVQTDIKKHQLNIIDSVGGMVQFITTHQSVLKLFYSRQFTITASTAEKQLLIGVKNLERIRKESREKNSWDNEKKWNKHCTIRKDNNSGQ